MSEAAPRYSPEQVLLSAIQMHAGQSVLWDALVSLLVASNQVNTQDLFVFIAHHRAKIPPQQDGPLARSVTDAAMSAILASEYGNPKDAPEWAQKVLSGELVPQHVNAEEFAKLKEQAGKAD